MSGGALFRLVAWAFALTLLALPVVGVLNGSFASDRWPLRRLELQAELKQVSAEQVQRVVAQHTGKGFFALSLSQLRDALAGLPWVESVEVRKRWPDTVSVRLLEFQPYAIWDQRALVSRSGRLFEVPGIESLGGLPRLSGPDGDVAEIVNFHAEAVRLLQPALLGVSQTHLSARGSWSLVLDGGAELVLGRNWPQERLRRFADTIGTLLQGNPDQSLRRGDLRYPNGYALTWVATAAPADASEDTATDDDPARESVPDGTVAPGNAAMDSREPGSAASWPVLRGAAFRAAAGVPPSGRHGVPICGSGAFLRARGELIAGAALLHRHRQESRA